MKKQGGGKQGDLGKEDRTRDGLGPLGPLAGLGWESSLGGRVSWVCFFPLLSHLSWQVSSIY